MFRVVIVGGGLSGLAAAFRIRQTLPAAQITLLESETRLGGKVGTDWDRGFAVERGPNGMFDQKPHTLQLCRDLGLGEELIAASEGSRKNRFLFWNEKLQALPGGPWALFKTPLLSLRGKLSMLMEPLRKRPKNLPSDETVSAFARRRFGKEAADLFLDALVTGIHAGDPEQLSVKAAFPRLVQFEAEFGSVFRGVMKSSKAKRAAAKARGEEPQPQRMWSFRKGLQVLIDRLSEVSNPSIVSGVRVTRLEQSGSQWNVFGEGSESWPADAVILTSPTFHQAELIQQFDTSLANEIGSIHYNSVPVVALGYREADAPNRPDGFGYIAPQRTRRDVLGVQWCSQIFPGRAPPGFVLWRALCGGTNRPDIGAWDDSTLLKAVHNEMKLAMGVTAEPVFSKIVRWPQAIPKYDLGHPERVERIAAGAERWPGLFLGGNGYRGIALNDCAEQAVLLAARVQDFAESRTYN